MWGAMEPSYAVSEPVVKLISSLNFQYADVADAPPGYPLCEIGMYSIVLFSPSKVGMQMKMQLKLIPTWWTRTY